MHLHNLHLYTESEYPNSILNPNQTEGVQSTTGEKPKKVKLLGCNINPYEVVTMNATLR